MSNPTLIESNGLVAGHWKKNLKAFNLNPHGLIDKLLLRNG